ncbi:MAG: glucose-6-phosphate dehydrogenase, partial [Acidobacteriota bacterium]|nr:glucose-6-phosphate dehydrogenase [Acidobacteriota bacterium]
MDNTALSEDRGRVADRCIMVIFGASGDLTTRKLLPALYNLCRSELLPKEFVILGFAIDDLSEEEFRKRVRENIHEYAGAPADCAICDRLADSAFYVKGDFKNPADYVTLKDRIGHLEQERQTGGNVFFYLATLPQFFAEIIRQVGEQGLTVEDNGRWRRVVIEKPFGSDLDSARALNK